MKSEAPEIIRVSWGPQHPMSGQTRILLDTDGEVVYNIIPDIGFTHRGVEKLLENREYVQGIPLIERLCMADTANMSLPYVEAIEAIAGVTPPKRAQYLRVILNEISRINSHLYAFGLMAEAGGGYPAVFLWTVADREFFLELAEMLTGTRWSYAYHIPGGVRRDLPKGFKKRAKEVINYFRERLQAYHDSWMINRVFKDRSVNVGVIPPELAIKLGLSGPSLRGSHVKHDMRLIGYEAYEELGFKIALAKECDSYARLYVRYLEMVESLRLIEEALENLPEGKIRERVPKRIPKGEAFISTESARGEISVHLISQGELRPYRVKIVSPTLRNLYALSQLPKHMEIKLADFPIILYSFDPWYLECDR